MRTYKAKNGYLIVINRKQKKVGSIFIASTDAESDRVSEVLDSDSEEFAVGDRIIADKSAGTILEDNDDGIILGIEANEVIAIVKED